MSLSADLRTIGALSDHLGDQDTCDKAADRIEVLEAALRRTEEHMRSFAEISPLDRTAETEAIIFCNAKLLEGA